MTPEALAALHARAMEFPAPWSAADFESVLSQDGTFLAHSPEMPAHAFALGRAILDEAELLTLATDPAHRHRGLARACLSAFETEAARRGAERAFLEVAATNAPALALYKAAGWTRSGIRKAYYRSGEGRIDALLMEKALLSD